MRWQTDSIVVLIAFLTCFATGGFAQVVTSNPLEWVALAEGNELINDQIDKQVNGQTKTAALQNTIAAEFTKIHEWERKYSQYLQTASGYASSLKAATTLYEDGVRVVINLGQFCKAINHNAQGIVASMSMNNLYVETATELVSIYTLLKNAVAAGGVVNMLTGAERSELLWALSDRLAAFNRKLGKLTLSIKYYTMMDVWNNVTAGMIDRNIGEIAGQAHARWRRVARITSE